MNLEAPTHPRYFSVQKAMEYVFVGEDRMSCNAIEESLEHTTTTGYKCSILLRFALLDCIVADRLFRGNWWDN